MKAMDIIDRVDMLEPNAFAPEQKLRWLSTLDGKVHREVIQTHESDMQTGTGTMPDFSTGTLRLIEASIMDGVIVEGDGLPEYTSGQEELLIPRPYGEDIYYYYIMAMMDAENNETQRYAKRMTQFNAAYQEFTNWYNRSHRPLNKGIQFI